MSARWSSSNVIRHRLLDGRTADINLQTNPVADSQWNPNRLGDFFMLHDVSDTPVLLHAWRVQLGGGASCVCVVCLCFCFCVCLFLCLCFCLCVWL
jgi:hypothetical protein